MNQAIDPRDYDDDGLFDTSSDESDNDEETVAKSQPQSQQLHPRDPRSMMSSNNGNAHETKDNHSSGNTSTPAEMNPNDSVVVPPPTSSSKTNVARSSDPRQKVSRSFSPKPPSSICQPCGDLASDVIHIEEVEWADPKSSNNPPDQAFQPKKIPRGDACGCSPDYNLATDVLSTKMCCVDMSCVLYACMEECRGNCEAGPLCGNKRIQNKEWKKVEVFDAGVKGRGLKLAQDIKKGDFIVEYVGRAIKKEYLDSLFRRYKQERMLYIMALGTDVYIDARHKGGVARYINHSCEPNCVVHLWKVRGILRAGVFALRDMKAGEELSFDYKWKRKRGRAPTKCYCDSFSCRGTLEEALDQSEEEEQEELKLQGHWKKPIKKNAGIEIMNRTIQVLSEEDRRYFVADVCKFDPKDGRHCLLFRGETEETWEDLSNRDWEILDEEMEQFVIARKAKSTLPQDNLGMTVASTSSEIQLAARSFKNYLFVQNTMKEELTKKHLVDRCQQHYRVQINFLSVSNSSALDPEEDADQQKAIQEAPEGYYPWKLTISGENPVIAREYLEKNITILEQGLIRQQNNGNTPEFMTKVHLHKHEIVVPRCVVNQARNRVAVIRSNFKNVDISFVHSQSKSKQFAKLLIESQCQSSAYDVQISLWKEVLTLCNNHGAPRTAKGLFKDLAFYGGDLSKHEFDLLCPKLSEVTLSQDCCENLRESAGLAAFEDHYRCTIWVQAFEDMGRIDSNNRRIEELSTSEIPRKIFFGCEPSRIPELWQHVKTRVADISRGVRCFNMKNNKEHLLMLTKPFDKRPRGMPHTFFDYLYSVSGATARLDDFSRNHIRIDGIVPINGIVAELDNSQQQQSQQRAALAEEMIEMQIELLRDHRIRQQRWGFGRDWSLAFNKLSVAVPKKDNGGTAGKLSPRVPRNRGHSIACLEIAEIVEVLDMDGEIAAHACIILYRYINQASDEGLHSSQAKQREILLACLFIAIKAQKAYKVKRLEGLLDGAYKIFYPGAKFEQNGEEAAIWEKRILSMEKEVLGILEFDVFWSGVRRIHTIVSESGKVAKPLVENVMELMLSGPVLAAGPTLWLKLGPDYAFAAMAALLEVNVNVLFSLLSLIPLKVYTAVEAITQSITSLKSKQKASKVSHEIFRTKDETLLKMKTRISELCNNGMMNGQISKFNRDPLGKAKELEIIARRTGKRRKIRGVSYFVLREMIFPCLQRIQNESQCTIYVEEAGDLDDTIIIEGGWRGLTLAEHLLRKATGNTHLPQSNETNPAEREVRVPGKLRPGLVNISALDASKAWEGVEDCSWDGKIGGKTCIPAQISRSALYEAELRWWVPPGYMPTLNGSMCNMVSIRRSFVSEDSRRVELSKIVRALEPLGYSQEKKTFSLLRLENDKQANDEKNLNVAVSLQRWPREKTESTEKKKGKGMGTGFSPAALQEMHLLHQLHFQIPSPQGHPNFVLPVAIAVEEEETQREKEAIQAKTIPDLLSGSSDAVLAFVEKIGNFEPEKESRVELNGSHLLFKSTPLVLQRLIGKSKKGKGMKPGFVPSTIVTAWFHDLLSAVAHCHDNHVILRTLHADQIHIDSSGVAKISGLARTMVLQPKDRRKFLDPRELLTKKKGKKSSNITKDDIASNQYMAPELILGSPRYTQESDVWALACLIIHLILGKSLFQGNKRESKMVSIYKIVGTASKNNYPGALDYPYFKLCQPEKKYSPGNLEKAFRYNFKDGSSSADSFSSILELLEKMLVLDPRKRISAANALKHSSMKDFLSSTNSDDFRNTFIEDWLSLKDRLSSKSSSQAKNGKRKNTEKEREDSFEDDLYNIDDDFGNEQKLKRLKTEASNKIV